MASGLASTIGASVGFLPSLATAASETLAASEHEAIAARLTTNNNTMLRIPLGNAVN
jgi:hypothetical protein